MKNSDLRLGNFIGAAFDDPKGFTCKVAALRESEIMPDKDFNGMEGEWWGQGCFEGIKLTEEWLMKLGFERSGEFWYEIRYDVFTEMGGTQIYELSINPEIGKCHIVFKGYIDAPFETHNGVYTSDYTTENVHDLQNLFYSLAGYELTIK